MPFHKFSVGTRHCRVRHLVTFRIPCIVSLHIPYLVIKLHSPMATKQIAFASEKRLILAHMG